MVTPYLTQHSPPALVAMLPPIEHISNEDGSGGYHSPCSRAAALTSAFSAPGSTTATRLAGSMLDRAHPVQAEHDAAGHRRRAAGQPAAGTPRHHRDPMPGAQRMVACTSLGVRGRTTASGWPASGSRAQS